MYRGKEKRELLKLGKSLNEDLTAMLLAMTIFVQEVSNWDGDLLEFTYMLNKLVFQHLMEENKNEP